MYPLEISLFGSDVLDLRGNVFATYLSTEHGNYGHPWNARLPLRDLPIDGIWLAHRLALQLRASDLRPACAAGFGERGVSFGILVPVALGPTLDHTTFLMSATTALPPNCAYKVRLVVKLRVYSET